MVAVERMREKWLVENNHNSARHRKNLTAAVRVPHWEVRLHVVTASLFCFDAWWITQICSAVENRAFLYWVQNYHDTTTPSSISAKWRNVICWVFPKSLSFAFFGFLCAVYINNLQSYSYLIWTIKGLSLNLQSFSSFSITDLTAYLKDVLQWSIRKGWAAWPKS